MNTPRCYKRARCNISLSLITGTVRCALIKSKINNAGPNRKGKKRIEDRMGHFASTELQLTEVLDKQTRV